ncbi:MAG: TadE/TadG family type IV pilus assembly protein [Candidatus Limnocylindria bacterium]
MIARERGQALVEFALALPLLLVFALAIVLVAQIGVARLALEHAAAEGARTGALTNDDALIRESVMAAAAPLDAAAIEIAIDPAGDEPPRDLDPRGIVLRVHVRYAIPAPLGFVGFPRFVVEGHAARRMEWTP